MVKKSETWEKYLIKKYGASWRILMPSLAKTFDALVEREEEEQIINETAKTIEESYQRGEKAEIRQKLLEGLENLCLSIVEGRQEQKQLNEKQTRLLEELENGIKTWKKALRGTDELFTILKSVTEDANKTRDEAREAIEKANATVEELKIETLRYNDLAIGLNKKYFEVNKKIEQYNARIKRLDRTRGS